MIYSFVNPLTNLYAMREYFRLDEIKQEWVKFNDTPSHVRRAIVAAEDANFCLHWGFDPEAIRISIAQGGEISASTISQQTAKVVMLWPTDSKLMRLPETFATFAIEAFWSKRRVLEIYMNIAEFGEGVLGIQAAAKENFNLDAAELNLEQASRLASVLKDPRNMDSNDLSPAQERRAERIADGATKIERDGRSLCFDS